MGWMAWAVVGYAIWVAGALFGWWRARQEVERARRDARIAWRAVEMAREGRQVDEPRRRGEQVSKFDGTCPVMRVRLAGIYGAEVCLQ